MNKPPPLNRDYSRDPKIKALKRRGFINHGSTFMENHMEKSMEREMENEIIASLI